MEQGGDTTQKPERKNVFQKMAGWYQDIPNKKPYIEFLTALLTIPVLLTVILLNLNSLRSDEEKKSQPEQVIITLPGSGEQTVVTATPSSGPCKEEIGPISVTSPEEKETVTNNPVAVRISYEQREYCAVVWSYRINGGRWSEYDDASIALYNPPSGDIKLELRVKSVVGTDEEVLTRNFTYDGETIITPTKTASSSAN